MTSPHPGDGVSTVNPANGETLAHYPFLTDAAVQDMLRRAERGFEAGGPNRSARDSTCCTASPPDCVSARKSWRIWRRSKWAKPSPPRVRK
ncbi:hypothetical protein [Asaia platycodi]|uniref:hypothetical protein n=1 Tax=Asaia platycodi TaxID=610243 RepID=UPI001F58443C|nr:hypothetical protein [Asaia platycodi]